MKIKAITLEQQQELNSLFRKESDRGAALVAASFLENLLGLYLESKMVDKSKKMKEAIFDNNGSLSTFSQRINFAQAFGYLGEDICKKLHTVRNIRNYFAHHPFEATFSTQTIKDLSNSLYLPGVVTQEGADFIDFPIERVAYFSTVIEFIMLYNQRVYGYANPRPGDEKLKNN